MKKKKVNRKLIILLSTVLIILLGVLAVLFMKGGTGENNDAAESETFSPMGDEEAGDSPMTIDTKYGNLYYPARWEKRLETKVKSNEVTFYAVIDKEKTKLFNVFFDSEEGSVVGHLEIDGKTVPVSVLVEELPADNDWSEGEAFSIYAMQEDVNYVIENLRNEPNFVAQD